MEGLYMADEERVVLYLSARSFTKHLNIFFMLKIKKRTKNRDPIIKLKNYDNGSFFTNDHEHLPSTCFQHTCNT